MAVPTADQAHIAENRLLQTGKPFDFAPLGKRWIASVVHSCELRFEYARRAWRRCGPPLGIKVRHDHCAQAEYEVGRGRTGGGISMKCS